MNNATDPLPSWRVLVDALKSAPVGENKLAQELERYCSPEDRNSLGEWDPIQLSVMKMMCSDGWWLHFQVLHAVIMETLANSYILILHNASLEVLSLY